MKIILSNSMDYKMKDTIIGAIAKSRILKNLVDNIEYLEFCVEYESYLGDKERFEIYHAGVYNADDYDRFMSYKGLSSINLLTDDYDITIITIESKSECFIKIIKYYDKWSW